MDDHAALSSSMLVPNADDGYSHIRQLSNFTRSSPKSRFRLPAGWGVKEVIRADGCQTDKYYIEPGTGIKFRSMKDVERRINGEIDKPRRRSSNLDNSLSPRSRKMIRSDGKMIKLDDEDLNECQLAIAHSYIATPNDLPDGWVVEEVPRRHGVGSDKYYYEPGTGLKFRSLREVERHLEAKELTLPEGWVVEEVPRRHGNYIDKYYCEPGTGKKFRSLLAVEKYLSKLKEKADVEKPIEGPSENAALYQLLADLKEYNTPLSKAFKLPCRRKNSGSCQKNISTERDQNSSFNTPPTKINWVLASPGGDMWNPFVGEKLVPESVKQQWDKTFMFMIGNQELD